jgi:hypothetical protein
VKPRDGGLPGTSSDQKPPASNHPKRPRPAGRPPRFRRS